MKQLLALLCCGVLFWGCSTELEVNAPYKNITIIYGLLSTKALDGNQMVVDETRHWVKINKAFLGEGDAFLFATIPDSNEYTNEQLQTAEVQEWNGSTLLNSYPLHDTLVDNRVPGTFNYPVHKLYYFDATLDPNNSYKVVVVARGETITASTPMVNDFAINPVVANLTSPINIMTGAGDYGIYDVKWNSGVDGRRWEASYRVRYREVRGTDTTDGQFTRTIGTRTSLSTDATPPEALNATIGAEDFYQGIHNLIPEDPSVTKRIFLGVDLLFAVASDDFHTYLQLSDPISGIVEERPDFTNVTNGYGLFGSRYFKQVVGKRLGGTSIEELCDGPYTGSMLWCVGWAGTDFSCP